MPGWPSNRPRTISAPCPTTSTIRCTPAWRTASITYSTIGRPQTSWITFGKTDFIRVLLPAARMIASAGWVF